MELKSVEDTSWLQLFIKNSRQSRFLRPPRAGAPLIPKLRGQFAEFLNRRSPERLRLLASPTCVSFSTVAGASTLRGFSRPRFKGLRLEDSALRHGRDQRPDPPPRGVPASVHAAAREY